jgi:hypothetical protein
MVVSDFKNPIIRKPSNIFEAYVKLPVNSNIHLHLDIVTGKFEHILYTSHNMNFDNASFSNTSSAHSENYLMQTNLLQAVQITLQSCRA